MADLPRKQKEYFTNIKKAISSGDDEMLADLVRQKQPLALREDLSQVLGSHVNENYDNPLNIFENKKLLEDVPITYTKNLPKGTAGHYVKDRGIFLPVEDSSNLNKQTGVKVHELGHANDEFNGFTEPQAYERIKNIRPDTGLAAAEEAFANHHEAGFFEKEALQKLLSGKKLSMLGALGAGAMALGAGNKAMAGDLPGAALDAGAIVDPTGITGAASQVRDRLNNPDYKRYSDSDQLQALPPGLDIEQATIQQNDNTPEDTKFKKIKQMIGR